MLASAEDETTVKLERNQRRDSTGLRVLVEWLGNLVENGSMARRPTSSYDSVRRRKISNVMVMRRSTRAKERGFTKGTRLAWQTGAADRHFANVGFVR